MKAACPFAAISLVLSVSAVAIFQNDHRHNNDISLRLGQGNRDTGRGSNNGASSSTVARSASSTISPSTASGVPSATFTATGSADEQSSLISYQSRPLRGRVCSKAQCL